MINFYNNLSPTTKLLIQSFLAVLGSVVAGVATAEYQSYTQAGRLDLQAQINVALVTFALLFGKAMHDWVPAHAQQLIKSISDEKAAMFEALQRSQNITSAAIATNGKQVQSTSNSVSSVPHVVVQPAQVPALGSAEIDSIAAQLAINLMNMAANRATQAVASTTPTTPTTPAITDSTAPLAALGKAPQ